MKQEINEATVHHCLSFELLRFILNRRPTEAELLRWLGKDQSAYHTLRKAKLLVLEGGVVQISPAHLTPNGRGVHYGNRLYHIDRRIFDIF
jgi:hypothetical protein